MKQQLTNTQALFFQDKETGKYYLTDGATHVTVEIPYRIDSKGVHCFALPENASTRQWLMNSIFEKNAVDEENIRSLVLNPIVRKKKDSAEYLITKIAELQAEYDAKYGKKTEQPAQITDDKK